MPETENRTLEDIELHFSDNSKTITDRNIAEAFSDRHIDRSTDKIDSGTVKCEPVTVLENGSNGFENKTQNGCDNRSYVNDA